MKKVRRVVLVSGDFPPMPSGIGDYTSHIAKALYEEGMAVTVVTTNFEMDSRFEQSGIHIRRPISHWQINEIGKLLSLLGECDTSTVVNIQYPCPTIYGRRLMINFLPAILRIRLSDIRVITTMHGFSEQSLKYRLRTLPMLRACHGLVYVDRHNHDMLCRYSGLPFDRMRFVPIASNIIPIQCDDLLRRETRRKLDITDKDIVIAYFGAIGPGKGFEHLLDAVEYVREHHGLPAVILAIGGFHSFRPNNVCQIQIQQKISKPEIIEWVRIVQEPNRTKVSKCLYIADIAVFPFVNGVAENSGSTLAALAHGIPTIITKGPVSNNDFVERCGAACVPPKDPLQLAKMIVQLVSCPEKRQAMRKKALSYSRSLTWKSIGAETAAFYNHILIST